MEKDVKQFISTCDKCQRIKPGKKSKAPLKPISTSRPLEILATDIAGTLPETRASYKYILVLCDHFSKFVVCFPMPDQTASTVAKCIELYCMRFGIPESLLIDQGTQFQAELVSELLDLFDIRRRRTCHFILKQMVSASDSFKR